MLPQSEMRIPKDPSRLANNTLNNMTSAVSQQPSTVPPNSQDSASEAMSPAEEVLNDFAGVMQGFDSFSQRFATLGVDAEKQAVVDAMAKYIDAALGKLNLGNEMGASPTY